MLVRIVVGLLVIIAGVAVLPVILGVRCDLMSDQVLAPPGGLHVLGTDHLGRDMLIRLWCGTRYSLGFAVGPVVIGAGIGIPLGLISAFSGRMVDGMVSAGVDILLALPDLIIALCFAAALGPGYGNIIIAVGISLIPQFARLARSAALSVKPLAFVEAAVAVGCPLGRVLVVHIIPNIKGPLLTLAAYRMATAVLSGSALSFLGLGVRPPTPEWGAMMASTRAYLRYAWWLCTFPGLAIFSVALLAQSMGTLLSKQRQA